MKALKRISLILALAVTCSVASFSMPTQNAEAKTVNISNWGKRDEQCTSLSTYAGAFYEKNNASYDVLSDKEGNTDRSKVPSSDLYKELQSLMADNHTYKTNYGETRYMYQYTDCVSNNTSKRSCFYTDNQLGSWDYGNTWNREHTWPQSKSLNGSAEGGEDADDIIMLRPTSSSVNNSRDNKAYGESSGYYDPNKEGQNVRGDCARIFLYVYVRWGNTSRAWGTSGVMESVDVLLRWMEEYPVDTWEMGRNDVVEDITGTRNVFVDYPEYAWLLFGEDVPDNMTTPSRGAKDNTSGGNTGSGGSTTPSNKDCQHEYGEWWIVKAPPLEREGQRAKKCNLCGEKVTEAIPKLGGDELSGDIVAAKKDCESSISGAAVLITMLGACVVLMKKREE